VVFMAGLPIILQHRSVLAGTWRGPPLATTGRVPEFYYFDVRTPGRDLDRYPAKPDLPTVNVGTGWCYTGMGYRPAPGLWAGNVAQVSVLPAGTVHSFHRTTRTFSADVELPATGRAIFNQTKSLGWHSNGGKLETHDGLTAVDLPPGRHRLELSYAPASMYWALVCSLFGVAAALAPFSRRVAGLDRRWRRPIFAAAAGVTLVAYVSVLLAARAERRSVRGSASTGLPGETGQTILGAGNRPRPKGGALW